MSFKTAAVNYGNKARTVNGMVAESTTGSAVLDLFSRIASSRGQDLSNLFIAALKENEELAIRVLLWARDIRGGAGERSQFRALLDKLVLINPSLAARVLKRVPELGRWDDVLSVNNSEIRALAFEMIRDALNSENSLAAKWMPRKGKTAAELARFLELSPKQYRKLLVRLTNVVETNMSKNAWHNIDFSKLPSVASMRYQKAFMRHTPATYNEYISALTKSDKPETVKINAGAVYPYQVLKSVYTGIESVAEEQWKALPDYLNGNSIFPIVDTSGSMTSQVRGTTVTMKDVAVSLGLYTAERNSEEFKDLLMIFAGTPKLVHLKGGLKSRIRQMEEIISNNTNLVAAFDMILKIARTGNVSSEAMPKTLLILSDMQFDRCAKYDNSAIEMIRRKYSQAGYSMPRVVFWNLNSYDNYPVKVREDGTALVSGFSPSILKAVMSNDLEGFTPYSVMLRTILSDRYAF